jgi:hypothetical protein
MRPLLRRPPPSILEKARREIAEIKSAAPNLRLTFDEGQTHGQFEVRFLSVPRLSK